MSDLVQINLGRLKDKRDDIVSFLEAKLGVSSVVEGGKIVLSEEAGPVRMKDVKTYLKRYLHREGLRRETRILVEKGEVNFVEVEREEE